MVKALTMCAIGIWLSAAIVNMANAVGTFRLTGPWPSSSAERKVTQSSHGCDHQRVHRSLHKHVHRVCMRYFESKSHGVMNAGQRNWRTSHVGS
jgi:hypothetical protein